MADDNDLLRAGELPHDPTADGTVMPAPEWEDPGPGTDPFELGDDVELGRHLADRLERSVFDRGELRRYRPEAGVWSRVSTEEAQRMAHDYSGRWVCYEKADGQEVCRPIRLNHNRVTGIRRVAQECLVQPGFFDERPAGVLFTNGFLNTDGVLEPPGPDHRVYEEHALSFQYDQAGRIVAFRRYLDDVFRGDADAEAKVAVVQEFLGAALVGLAPRYQRCLLAVGDGENGKGVLFGLMGMLFPADAVTAVPPHEMHREYDRARLARSLINIVSELPGNEIRDSAAFKAAVVGDRMKGRFLRENVFEFEPSGAHVISANKLPSTRDHSHAFWRRFIVLTFNNQFVKPPDRPDPDVRRYRAVEDLKERLAAELPQIAGWAILGMRRLVERGGYTLPSSHDAAISDWRAVADSVYAFASACVRASDGDEAIGSDELYQRYRSWCDRHGVKPVGNNVFSPGMERLGFVKERNNRGKYWRVRLFQG